MRTGRVKPLPKRFQRTPLSVGELVDGLDAVGQQLLLVRLKGSAHASVLDERDRQDEALGLGQGDPCSPDAGLINPAFRTVLVGCLERLDDSAGILGIYGFPLATSP